MATFRTVKDLATGLPRQPYTCFDDSRSVTASSIWHAVLGNFDGMLLLTLIIRH